MACGTLKSFTQDSCLGNIGGIKRVWLAEYDANDTIVMSADTDGNSFVSAVTFSDSAKTWNEFYLKKNSAQATSEYQVGDGGSVFCQTTLELNFNRQDAAKRAAIQSLALNELFVIYEDANGYKWFLGKDNPVTLSAGGGETGTQKTDLNKYNVSLVDDSMELPYRVDDNFFGA